MATVNSADGPVDPALSSALGMPFDRVYRISTDGRTYVTPLSLRGTPINAVAENSSYWEQSWVSLDEYIRGEPEQERLKEHYYRLKHQHPNNKEYAAKHKRYQDKVSWQRKIREVFGSGRYNPNQLVSKFHLPPQGICGDEQLLYHLACKVSDLQVLEQRRELSMDAWDWLRWRVSLQLDEKLPIRGSGRGVIKGIASKLGTEAKDADLVFRAAVERSARLTGRGNSFGSKKKQRPYTLDGTDRTKTASKGDKKVWHADKNKRVRIEWDANEVAELRRRRQLDKQKKRQAQSQASTYQGVNAYRRAKENNPPCAG